MPLFCVVCSVFVNAKRCNFYLETGYEKIARQICRAIFMAKKMGKRGGMDVIN